MMNLWRCDETNLMSLCLRQKIRDFFTFGIDKLLSDPVVISGKNIDILALLSKG